MNIRRRQYKKGLKTRLEVCQILAKISQLLDENPGCYLVLDDKHKQALIVEYSDTNVK